MSEITVLETRIDLFDRVEVVKDGKVDYDGEYLKAAYKADAEPSEYVVANFNYDNAEQTTDVTIPDGSIILEMSGGNLRALVPSEAYGGGE